RTADRRAGVETVLVDRLKHVAEGPAAPQPELADGPRHEPEVAWFGVVEHGELQQGLGVGVEADAGVPERPQELGPGQSTHRHRPALPRHLLHSTILSQLRAGPPEAGHESVARMRASEQVESTVADRDVVA